MPGMRYQPQGRARVDRNIAADFAWLAPSGAGVIGPATTLRAGRIGTSAGVAINSGYASLPGRVPSMHTTTWTESGVVWLNGTDEVVTLSARATGQAVAFQPSLNRINLVMWGVTDVLISGGALPTGPVHYVARRAGSLHTVWINGKLYGSATSSQSPVAFSASSLPAVGARAFTGTYAGTNPLLVTTGILSLVRTPLGLSDDRCLALSMNHWQAFAAPDEEDETATPPGSGDVAGAFLSALLGAGLAADGQITAAGALSSTLSGATLAAAGTAGSQPDGTLASSLAGAAMSASGAVAHDGALASTLGGASMTASGPVTNRGALASSLDGASLSASGAVVTNSTGIINTTLAGAALAAGGYVGIPPEGPDFFIRLPKNPRHSLRH